LVLGLNAGMACVIAPGFCAKSRMGFGFAKRTPLTLALGLANSVPKGRKPKNMASG
jgi:hypothetical protein